MLLSLLYVDWIFKLLARVAQRKVLFTQIITSMIVIYFRYFLQVKALKGRYPREL